jgi:drug/metabolite transporter (DMT)-like permease
VQYVFLSGVPASVSQFAFITLANLIGFAITFEAFFSELFRINRRQLLQSVLLAAEMFLFNVFLLLGSSGMEPSVTAFALTGYLFFIPVIYFFMKRKVTRANLAGIAIVLAGLFLTLGANPSGLADVRILYLLLADVFFACYIITVEIFCNKSNPSVLAMGRMFFGFIFSLACWMGEIAFTRGSFTLPGDAAFWNSVTFIGIFMYGFYCVTQIYAQRYINAVDTALIFSTESVIALLVTPPLALLTGGAAETITVPKIIGCAVILAGVLVADGTVFRRAK